MSINSSRRPLLIGGAVVVFSAVQCRGLLSAWAHSPFDHWGWVVFGMWLCPIVLYRPHPVRPVEWLLVAAAGCSLGGAALDINALRYAGLALSLAAFLPGRAPGGIFWAGVAVSWMPVFGFLGSRIGLAGVLAARFGMILVALLLILALARKQTRLTGTAIRASL
jgi:hypothetical protein